MKVMINVNGVNKEVEAKPRRFSTIGESWAEYQLEDGRTVRAKFVLTHVNQTEELDSNGNPIFTFNGQPVFAVDEPCR